MDTQYTIKFIHKQYPDMTIDNLYLDDSVQTVKLKISEKMGFTVAIEEMYIFAKRQEKLNTVAIFQALTKRFNKKADLTLNRANQVLQNIEGIDIPINNEFISYDDLYKLNLDEGQHTVFIPVGQHDFLNGGNPFIYNPDLNTDFNSFPISKSLNSQLLLNTGRILDNILYVGLAEDVLTKTNKMNDKEILKRYFPSLFNKNIDTIDEIRTVRERLIANNKKHFNPQTLKVVDAFYNIYLKNPSDLQYLNRGIKSIVATLNPDFDVKLPLEVVFKIIHATATVPFIKYNPSTRQENVYRLYTGNQIATNGQKIPVLKKGTIFRLIKNIGKTKSVAVYIRNTLEISTSGIENELDTVVCEFDEEGYITISGEFDKVKTASEIDEMFKKLVNPVISEVKAVLEQSGYKLRLFDSIQNPNTEIYRMTYSLQITLTKPLTLNSGFSAIFIDETNYGPKNKNKEFSLRFKRVANFSKFTSQEAFILEKAEQGMKGTELVQALIENFPDDLTEEKARELVRKVANEIEVEQGANKREIRIRENPGFKIRMITDPITSILTIETQNIDNLLYLETLPVYFDTIIRVSQDRSKTTDLSLSLNSQTNNSNTLESINRESLKPSIEGEFIEKPKGAFDLLFSDDFLQADDNESDLEGGADSDSESSIDSLDSFNPVIKPVINSVAESESSLSSIKQPIESESSLSSIKQPIESEPSLSSIKQPVESSLSSIKQPIESESSLSSIKQPTESESPLSSIKPAAKSESSLKPVPEPIEEKMAEPLEELEEQISDKISEQENPDKRTEFIESIKNTFEISPEDEPEDMKNIDGMKLNKPYYFQTLIEKKDPVLIIKEDSKEFNSYSRTCESSKRRIPVVLTDAELEKIKKENPGFIRDQDVLKYGSDKDHQFNYICPRYWCLKTNTAIDPKDLKEVIGPDGKKELVHPTCGKVLPRDEKKVKPGYYIYEFVDKDGSPNSYPGVISGKHPKGLCLPCCFKDFKKAQRNKVDTDCKLVKDKKEPAKREIDYILGPEKFPLDTSRWGFLSVELESLFKEIGINTECTVNKDRKDKTSRSNPCILRHGIQINKQQSFIAAIADVLHFGQDAVVPSIADMRQKIIAAITLDSFMQYQNGNLVLTFAKNIARINFPQENEMSQQYSTDKAKHSADKAKYENTALFKRTNFSLKKEAMYFNQVATAFENFVEYLSDDDALIDHTYLWDIMSIPNPALFPQGVNLLIFHIPKDDITNNVQLLCPTNHYSSELYTPRKPSIFLVKEDGYYEPLYTYSLANNNVSVAKEFRENDPNLILSVKTIFKRLVAPFFNAICRPKDSLTYKMVNPPALDVVIDFLDDNEFVVEKLVSNYAGKIIGVKAEYMPGEQSGFIPCYPSAIRNSTNVFSEERRKLNESAVSTFIGGYKIVYMDDSSLWTTFQETMNFLSLLKPLKIQAAFSVVEDEMTVGILTNTNQFIQIAEPELATDELPVLTDQNYMVNAKNHLGIDEVIMTSDTKDVEREDYIQKIKLETGFYNTFRTTVRVLLNDYENREIRDELEASIGKEYMLDSEKLETVVELLQKLVDDKVQFTGDENYYKLIKGDIESCVVKDKEQCALTANCLTNGNSLCSLILPEENLISGKSNEAVYYFRMADELIRYSRIKNYMFQPQTYLSFGSIDYKIRSDEMIIVQSLITQEFFESLTLATTNKYVNYISHDDAAPAQSQIYENTVSSLVEDKDKDKLPPIVLKPDDLERGDKRFKELAPKKTRKSPILKKKKNKTVKSHSSSGSNSK